MLWSTPWSMLSLRGDREVVLAAVRQNAYALQYASKAVRGDREVALAAVKRHGYALCHASEALRGDKAWDPV